MNLGSHLKYFFILIVVSHSCIDPIEFEVPAGLSNSLVIQSRVVLGDTSYVEVLVSRLFDFSAESRQPVSVRSATLSDDSGHSMVLETRTPGIYRVILDDSTPIQARIDQAYSIRIETFDQRIFESSFEEIPPNDKPDQLAVSIVSELVPDILGKYVPTDRIQLSITTDLNENIKGGLYWEVNNIFQVTDSPNHTNPSPALPPKTCYLTKTADVNEIFVLDPDKLSAGRIENYNLLISNIDFRFAEGLYYEVKQYSLNNRAFNYWNSINILSERDGSMFDMPVGEVKTNIENISDPDDQVFGYFFATQEEVSYLKVAPDFIGNIGTLCPPPPESMCNSTPGEGCTCGLCCDCLIDPDATLVRPSYWID